MNTNRTISQTATDIEKAVNEVNRLVNIKYKEYEQLKDLESQHLSEQREKMNTLGNAKITALVNLNIDTPEHRAKISRVRQKHSEKMRKFDEDVAKQMRFYKRAYLSDCNTAIKQTCLKYDLNVKIIKRILGRDLKTEMS